MQRFYFLIPKLETTKKLVDELKKLGVSDQHIHVLGKQDSIKKAHLHPAGLMDTSDVKPALIKGAITGGITGFLAGLAAVLYPLAGFVLGSGVILGLTAFGIIFGAWASSMIGVSVKSPIIAQYEKAVKRGQFLMIVDFKHTHENELLDLIKSHHPEVIINRLNLLNTPTEVWDEHHHVTH